MIIQKKTKIKVYETLKYRKITSNGTGSFANILKFLSTYLLV